MTSRRTRRCRGCASSSAGSRSWRFSRRLVRTSRQARDRLAARRGGAGLQPGARERRSRAPSPMSASSTGTPCSRRTSSRRCSIGSRLDPDLGVAGGALIEQRRRRVAARSRRPRDHATGPCRIYRRDCLETIGGIPVRLGSDPIAVTYARVNGYKRPDLSRPPGSPPSPDGEHAGEPARPAAPWGDALRRPLWPPLGCLALAQARDQRAAARAGWPRLHVRLPGGRATRRAERVEDDEFVAYVRREQRNRLVSGLRRSRAGADGDHGASPRPRDPGAGVARSGARTTRARDRGRPPTIEAYGDRSDWIGSDPYEGLNATRFVTPLKRTFRGRQVVIQAVKRSPARSPAGAWDRARPQLGDARLGGLDATPAPGSSTPRSASASCGRAWRRSNASGARGFDEPCWGYHFDTQSRVFFYSKRDPNTIATAFAAQALLDAYDRTARSRCSWRRSGWATSSCATSARREPPAAPTSATSSATERRSRTPTRTSARSSPG